MIKENQKLLNQIQVVLDGIVIILAYALSWYIRFRSGIFELDEWYLSLQEYMKWLWGIVPGFLMLYYIFKLYVPKRVLGRRLEAWRILQANIIGVMALIVVLYVIKQPNISRTMLFVFGVVDVFGEVLERNLVRIILRKIRKNGYNLKHIILVGYSNAAEEYIDRIKANPEWGYQIRGILDDSIEIGSEYKGINVIGCTDDLQIILPENKLDEIVITLGLDEYNKLRKIVNMCEKSGVHTKFIPDYNNIIPTKPYTEDIQVEPKSLYGFMLPLFTEFFVDKKASGKYCGGYFADDFEHYSPSNGTQKELRFLSKLNLTSLVRSQIKNLIATMHDIDSGITLDEEFLFAVLPIVYASLKIDELKEIINDQQKNIAISESLKRDLRYILGEV